MIAGIWRNTHFLLAITASLFLFIAALSGAILGVEAALDRATPQAVNITSTRLGEAKESIELQFDEVYEIALSTKGFLVVQGVTGGDFGSFYVDPNKGTVLGEVIPPSPFFQFIRTVHRSLFLKKTGRILMSFVSFLLVLLVLSGLLLLRKRLGGFMQLYTPLNEQNLHRKTHINLGRWLWLIVLVVGATGTYLGLERLDVFSSLEDEKKIFPKGDVQIDLHTIPLRALEKMIYPFSQDESDVYDLILTDKTLRFQQGDFSLVEESFAPLPKLIQQWSYFLHTGEGSLPLALLLSFTALSLVYFIFSGLLIASKTSWALLSLRRRQENSLVILYGSETGNTYRFAKQLWKQLRREDMYADLLPMNRFRLQEKTKTLIVMTATYGEGEAPSNATQFERMVCEKIAHKEINYVVLGFGSRSYPKFCQFAVDIAALLEKQAYYTPLMPLFKINNQEEKAYTQWENMLLSALKRTPQSE